jgi:hypothetical protein
MTAANGASSGTLITLYGWSIYDVRITLNVTFCFDIPAFLANYYS